MQRELGKHSLHACCFVHTLNELRSDIDSRETLMLKCEKKLVHKAAMRVLSKTRFESGCTLL